MKMFTIKEEKNIAYLLTKTDPETGLFLEELHGLLFGLAMTPEIIPVEEWFPLLCGEEPAFDDDLDAEACLGFLITAYERMVTDGLRGKLAFPFDYNKITEDEIILIDGWTYGLFLALSLRPTLWGMEREYTLKEIEKLPADVTEIMDACSVIISIAVPEEMEEGFKELMEAESMDQNEIMDMFYGQLPLAVETLQKHGLRIRESNLKGKRQTSPRKAIRKEKTGQNNACPCGSGRKHKKCCGNN